MVIFLGGGGGVKCFVAVASAGNRGNRLVCFRPQPAPSKPYCSRVRGKRSIVLCLFFKSSSCCFSLLIVVKSDQPSSHHVHSIVVLPVTCVRCVLHNNGGKVEIR